MPHPSFKDMTGQTFGRLTVLRKNGNHRKGFALWLCRCSCGNACTVAGLMLRKGRQVSCGCFRKERGTKHGQSTSPIYKVWTAMKGRCGNPRATGFEYYGGRGISVHSEWLEFEPFMAWAKANGYAPGLSIDRIDTNAGYSPDNCRWVTPHDQSLNMRRTKKTIDGIPWSSIARENGLPDGMFSHRVSYGWPESLAATLPKHTRLSSALKRIHQGAAPGDAATKPKGRLRHLLSDGRLGVEVAKANGISAGTFNMRVTAYGWTPDRAATIPIRSR
jgi:hypothetical protein